MITPIDFFYDGQMRRFLEQIVRAFSGFQYETGYNGQGAPQQIMVPCRMAATDRMVANILRNNSENAALAAPMITVWMTGLKGRREDIHNTSHEETVQVTERAIDNSVDPPRYTGEKGRSYTVQRLMPRAFEMTVQIDIWTTNQNQKHQLAEQIFTIIYPDFYIQNSDHALDWSAFSLIKVEDINWSSRSIPVGTDTEIDIMTITMSLPFWLSPPVKVKQQRIIQQVITNIASIEEGIVDVGDLDSAEPLTRVVTTPGNHFLRVDGNVLTLLGPKAGDTDANGDIFTWQSLFDQYGLLRPTISEIRLKTNPDLEDWTHDIIGTIQMGANPNELLFQIDPDTLPANTMQPISGVIDPLQTWPGNGLPNAVAGQRYLLIEDVSNALSSWGTLTASANDVIEYQGGQWIVSFDASALPGPALPQYTLNLNTGRQLRWNGHEWVLTVDGEYPPGMWRLSL